MIDPRHISISLLLSVAVILSAWAVVAATNDVPNEHDTITHILRRLGRTVWGVPYAFGVLVGHFWVSLRIGDPFSPWFIIVALVSIGCFFTAVGILVRRWLQVHWPAVSIVLIAAGIIAGGYFWP